MSKSKFSYLRTRTGTPEELAELNATRLRERGFVSSQCQEVTCGACGAVTFVAPAPRKGRAEETQWGVDPAELANPLTPEEIAAQEAVTALQREQEAAMNDLGLLHRKLAEAHGELTYDGAGQPQYRNRNEQLVQQAEGFLAEQRRICDEIAERVRLARVRHNRLCELRGRRLEAWRNEQSRIATEEFEKSRKNGQRGARQRVRERLRELLEG
jgi:hypothetical protein